LGGVWRTCIGAARPVVRLCCEELVALTGIEGVEHHSGGYRMVLSACLSVVFVFALPSNTDVYLHDVTWP
jgi:hypothetical protein